MVGVAFDQATELPAQHRRPATHSGTILVVEDEPLIRELITEALEEEGVRVLAAATAVEALHLVKAERVDLLFTDIDLGPGPNGLDLAQVARSLRPGLAVIYTSGRLRGCDLRDAVPESAFVPKPYRSSQVRDRIRASLAAQPR